MKDANIGLLPGKKRRAGLHLHATDIDWDAGGTGDPEVTGTGEALLLAMAGRPVALDELDGPGVATLRSRTGDAIAPTRSGPLGGDALDGLAQGLLPPPCWPIISLVMSPWTLTLPAMNACIPACWLPGPKTSLAVP